MCSAIIERNTTHTAHYNAPYGPHAAVCVDHLGQQGENVPCNLFTAINMEYHLDREIRLCEESEFKNLYAWSLQEDGKIGGSPQIPWEWSLYFVASELRYSKQIEIMQTPDDIPGQPESEYITATLKSGDDRQERSPTRFSMFGTDRSIEKFSLSIRRLKDDDTTEHCEAWGIVSYTSENDFRESTQDDVLGVDIWLASRNFDDLRHFLRHKSHEDFVMVRLGGVSGFYSDWSPSISTSHVKVLTSWGEDHKVLIPEGCTIDPPRLGKVGEFSLTFTRRSTLTPQKAQLDATNKEDVSAEHTQQQEVAPAKQQFDAPVLTQLIRTQEGITKLCIVLWIIAILIAAHLLFK